jgi:anti-sigma B factor antagonist
VHGWQQRAAEVGFSIDGDVSPVVVAVGRRSDGEPLVSVFGEVDDDPHDVIQHSIADAAAGGETVHVDLTGVRFLGSAGLAVLVRAGRALEAEGKRLRVDVASPMVRRVLEVTAVAEYFGLTAADGRHRP